MREASQARLLAVLFAAFLAAPAVSWAEPLDLKLGLWESTITTESSGAPPMDTSRLTSEQKARLEAMLKQRAAQGPATRVYKSCLTRDKLAEDPLNEPPRQGEKCTIRVISQTKTTWQGNRTCTRGAEKTQYAVKFSALSREQVKGTGRGSISDGVHTMSGHGSYSSKWLSANCGDVK